MNERHISTGENNTMILPDRGLSLTCRAIHRTLRAMAWPVFEIRLIHQISRTPYPGQRLWTQSEVIRAAKFLRLRNKEGFSVYFRPYAGNLNAGCVLVDLDRCTTGSVERMRADGHAPCVVIETSPCHLQAWIRISTEELEPPVATHIAKHLACAYGGDPASADWRHLGRLPGFTNQKPQHRKEDGMAPWVLLRFAKASLAATSESLVSEARASTLRPTPGNRARIGPPTYAAHVFTTTSTMQYADVVGALGILGRFPSPNWSIVDKWVAKELLRAAMPTDTVMNAIRSGSPLFPRGHSRPDDYLRRTVRRAAQELHDNPFPARPLIPPSREKL